MTAGQRLTVALAISLVLGGSLLAAAEWWWADPATKPARAEPTGDERRAAELRAAIAAQEQALREARAQRGEASAELQRLDRELSTIRREVEGLREYLGRRDGPSE